jgi:hypothetical protein
MKRLILLSVVCVLMVVSLLAAQAVFAQEEIADHANGHNPSLDPHANACLDGGTLAGKCDSEALWNAGWYLIRFEQGSIDVEHFPAEYAWVLPNHQSGDNTHESTSDPHEEVCLEPAPSGH